MADLNGLLQQYHLRSSVRELFDWIIEHGVEEGRTTVDELTSDGSTSRREAINVLRELAELGCGEFKVGRKGHPSRLEWSEDPADIVDRALHPERSPAPEPAPRTLELVMKDDVGEVEEPQQQAAEDDTAEDGTAEDDAPQVRAAQTETERQRTFDLGDATPAPPASSRRRAKPKARVVASSDAASIEHVFVLRPDARVHVELPADLSAKEAEVLASWIRSLSFER